MLHDFVPRARSTSTSSPKHGQEVDWRTCSWRDTRCEVNTTFTCLHFFWLYIVSASSSIGDQFARWTSMPFSSHSPSLLLINSPNRRCIQVYCPPRNQSKWSTPLLNSDIFWRGSRRPTWGLHTYRIYFQCSLTDSRTQAIPSCVSPERPPRYEVITAGEHVERRVKAMFDKRTM